MFKMNVDKAKEINRGILKADRDAALAALTHDFLDGRVMQTRPQDVGNMQLAIAEGVALEWIMEDNTPHKVTAVELQEALASGVAAGKAVWQAYIDGIKAL